MDDDDWDDAVLNEQVRLLRRTVQGHVNGAAALTGKRSATALGLGQGRSSRRKTSDTRSDAPAAVASSVALAAVAPGARGRHVAHAGTGHMLGVSAQLSPTKATGAVEAAARAKAAKANKAKENAIMKANKLKAKADKAKANMAKASKKQNKAPTTAKTATAHCSETRVAPTTALLPFPHANALKGVLIRVGTECSGMEPVAMALRNLGVLGQCSLEFCCEINKWCKNFILQNHPPKRFFDDITLRDPRTTPPCDLYVAGFPCQPFSRAGLRQGRNDAKGRGSIFDHIITYLRAHRPRAVILENVAGLQELFAETFREMLASLRDIKGNGNQPYYVVSKRLVDTAKWGLPHSRKRIYIVCLSQEAMRTCSAPFLWPRPSIASTPIDDLLQPTCGSDADLLALGPRTRDKLLAYLEKLHTRGYAPGTDTWIINVFGRVPHGMRGQSPCLTRGRAGAGGHWVSSRSRLLTVQEMLILQGMAANVRRAGISDRQLGLMIGNAMSVNVLERLLVRLLPGVGLLRERLHDRWA